jgi:hypothetical protein
VTTRRIAALAIVGLVMVMTVGCADWSGQDAVRKDQQLERDITARLGALKNKPWHSLVQGVRVDGGVVEVDTSLPASGLSTQDQAYALDICRTVASFPVGDVHVVGYDANDIGTHLTESFGHCVVYPDVVGEEPTGSTTPIPSSPSAT